MELIGTYAGVVEDNRDPEKLGRLKIRVPHAYGAVGGTFGGISTDNIPWALPAGLPAGLSAQSGGMDWLPGVGDQVLVRFLDAEPEKPVWEWFVQTTESATNFKLHSYDKITTRPDRGALTRYGHTVEWNDSGLILTTSKGYRMLLTDADTGFDGDILIETQAGQSLEFDDLLNTVTLNVNQDFYAYVMEQALVDCGNFQLNAAQEIGMNAGADVTITSGAAMTLDAGADLTVNVGEDTSFDMAGDMDIKLAGALILNAAVTADLNITGAVSLLLGANLNIAVTGKATLGATGGLTIISPANIAIQFAQLMLGTGVEPYVKGATFLAFLEQFVAWAQLHQHVSATPGTPTSPAIIPVPVVPDILSETILGQ